jgi:hypothetical protein
MGSVSPANLTAALLDATPLAANTPGTPAPTNGSGGAATSALPTDQFTPSNETSTLENSAQAAGLFTVAQGNPFTSAADSLLAQFAPGPENGASTNNPAAANASNAAGSAASAPPKAAALTTATSGADSAAANMAPSPGTVSVQNQLQSLNNVLQALGLTAADIREVDQIASRINDFSPTTFTNLAYELVALAREAAPQTAAPAATTASVAAAAGSGGTSAATKAASA